MSQHLNKEEFRADRAGSSFLRVALVTSSLKLAGAEKQTVYMARALLRAGIDARLFYLGGGGHYEPVLRQIGVPVIQIYAPNRPWLILARQIGAFWRMRPHIVLVPQFGDLLHGATAGRFCKALTLGGIRSDGWQELSDHGHLSRWMLRLAHGFVANSCRARKNLEARGYNPHRVEVLPNVIDLQDFDSRSALPLLRSLPAGRVIAAAVGRLHPCKRFDRFLEALALARRSEPALAGVIAGADCGARIALQERANALGLTSSDLTFLGECEQIPALLARVELLVLTSAYEGFPNVILEAMAARLPVITTPAGDARLVVQHGRTGYAVEGEDIPAMAEFMVQMARSPSMRLTFGEAGRKRVEQEYNYESLADRLMAIFRRFTVQQRKASLLETLGRGIGGKKADSLSGGLVLEGPAA